MTKKLSTSFLILALLAPVVPAAAATRADCQRALKEAIPACVKACDGQPVPRRFKNLCKKTCRSRRYKKTYMQQCLAFFVPGGDTAPAGR